MNKDFIVYMQKQAEQPAWTDQHKKDIQGIVKRHKPGLWRSATAIVRDYFGGPDWKGMEQDAGAPIPRGLSRLDLEERLRNTRGYKNPYQKKVEDKAYAGVEKELTELIGGSGKRNPSTWEKIKGLVTGSQMDTARSYQALLDQAKKDPKLAEELGLQKHWYDLAAGAMLKGMEGADLEAYTRRGQKRAAKAMWDQNKGWLLPAGIGVGGLGLLALMMWGMGGRKGGNPQQPVNININTNDPNQRWNQNRNWAGYNYRANAPQGQNGFWTY